MLLDGRSSTPAQPGGHTAGMSARIERAMHEGNREFKAGELGLARLHFEHAIGYVRQSGELQELLPELIGMTGRCLQRQKRWTEALECYAEAAEQAKDQDLPAEQLRWSGKLAITHLDMRARDSGVPLLEKSVEFGRRLYGDNVPGVIEELAHQIGRLANQVEGDRDRAGALWREAFELLEKSPNQASRFYAAYNYSSFLLKVDRPRQAETYLEEALEIAGRANLDRSKVGDALEMLCGVYRNMKEFERGGDKLMVELPHFDDSRLRHDLMAAAVDAYFDGSVWEKMKGVSGDLWRLLENQSNPLARADMGGRYAIACREVGDLEEAATVLRSAVQDAVKAGDASFHQKMRAELARVLFEQGKHELAAAAYEELWNEGFLIRLIVMRYAEALLAVGRVADAKTACTRYLESGGDEADVSIPRARIADAEGNDSIDAWRSAAVQSRGSDRAMAFERLLRALPHGDPERLSVCEELVRIPEKVRSQVTDLFSENAWRAVSPVAGRFNLYLDTFLEEAVATQRHDDAVYELERFRSQLLVDILSERANIWAGERRTLGEKSIYADRAHRDQYRYEALSAMNASWAERREAAEAADDSKSRALTAGRVILFGNEIFGMQFPRNLADHLAGTALSPRETLLFQRTTPRGTHLWYRGAEGAVKHEFVSELTMEVAQRLDTQLRTEADISATLEELDQKLGNVVSASLHRNGAKRAFVVGGTDVANLPLDHCDSFTRSGAEIGFLPTARALGFARAPRFPSSEALYIASARERRRFAKELIETRGPRALVVIDPTQSLRYAELEGVSVALVAAKYLDVEIVEGPKASKQNVQGAVGGYGHLHLISHGRFDGANPYRTGMYMDPTQSVRSIWTVADVFGDVAAPAGRLAVLAGCETGALRGNTVSEEISLPAAFVAAGFASVVASRWPVDDLSAALFMTEFYRVWLPGKITVAAALRAAAQWLRTLSKASAANYLAEMEKEARETDSNLYRRMRRLEREARADLVKRRALPFSDPRHWAAFYIVGDAAQRRRV